MNDERLTIGSLFSGIGGIELGLERTEGFRTIWQCEIDPYASAVLKKHWPNVPNLGDITKVRWEDVAKPDLICGGFPCQDISIAGKGKGILEGARSKLWSEFARAIRELRPRYALVENVPELANRGLWLVLADLAKMGYDAEWQIVSAAEVGALHKRERLFVIAHSKRFGCSTGSDIEREHEDNTKGKQIESIEEKRRLRSDTTEIRGTSSNDNSNGLEANTCNKQLLQQHNHKEQCNRRLSEMDRPSLQMWKEEPPPLTSFCGVADGLSNRVERIKCLGNAVVPQCAEVIGEMILEMSL